MRAFSLTHDGQPRWHCVETPAKKECHAEGDLRQWGVIDSFHPVETSWTMKFGKRVKRETPYIPRFVFALFPGPIILHRVLERPFVRDVMRLSTGHPAILHPDDLRMLNAMRSVDEAQRQRDEEARRIRQGDKVKIVSGVLSGEETEVLELRGGSAKIKIRMFGSEHEAQVRLSDVEKVA